MLLRGMVGIFPMQRAISSGQWQLFRNMAVRMRKVLVIPGEGVIQPIALAVVVVDKVNI